MSTNAKPTKEELEAAYMETKSCYILAKRFGCGHVTVYNWLKKYNIPIIPMSGRKLSPAHREKVVATLRRDTMKGRKLSQKTREAMSKSRTGTKNANYKGGITKQVRAMRHTKEYAAWRRLVLKRADGKCEICGKKLPLEAHHKISLFKDISSALDPDNGMGLCHDCHLKADGKGN